MKGTADPNLIVYFDGKYMPLRDAQVNILTHALHYGTGVFEGIRAHWVPATVAELCAITVELMRRNAFHTNVYVRPLAYKSAERVGVSTDDQDAFAVVALPFGEYLHSDKGLHAGVSSWRRIEDNAIPARAKICGAYVNSALASDDARQAGFDEAIFLNENGHVAEGATCNIFMVRDGKLITPGVTENALEGITRNCIMELAFRQLGLRVIERPIDRSELYVCDELFLTGTAVGVAPIVRVDHRPVRDGAIGAVTHAIQELYFDATRGHLQAYWNWLTPVYQSRRKHEQELVSTAESM